jgi:hypothetical protein
VCKLYGPITTPAGQRVDARRLARFRAARPPGERGYPGVRVFAYVFPPDSHQFIPRRGCHGFAIRVWVLWDGFHFVAIVLVGSVIFWFMGWGVFG